MALNNGDTISHIGTFFILHDGVGLWGSRNPAREDLYAFNAIPLFGRNYEAIGREIPDFAWITYEQLLTCDICHSARIYLDNVDGNYLENEYSKIKSKSGFITPHNVLHWNPNLHYLIGGHYGHTV